MVRPTLNFSTYYPQIDEISDADLRAKTHAVLQDIWQASSWQSLEDVPTSREIPYPNLPHTQCVVELSLAIADIFRKYHGVETDRDHLIAAAVLQDASKLVEYAPGEGADSVQRTPIGQWTPHAFWCAHLCALHEMPMAVTNTILTHSPQAAQFPQTIEGKILYYADQLDVIAIYKDRWTKKLFVTK
ncbi:hypothetical protein [Bordetella sp. LUAb4]|uniref:hypothetical protein n=1 Tax=Bordetella sp. LUAb4 TaxID=2843195 RepID=UPI001E478C62|nr:hypothetical protein [Bordetella sp. LUAb4]